MSGDDEYRLTCGARTVGWNWTYPFVKFVATPDRIEIKMPWFAKFELPRARITSIRPHKGMMSKGLFIDTSIVDANLIIWTQQQTEALDALARLGYPVSKLPLPARSWWG